jgi:hypothetical protein
MQTWKISIGKTCCQHNALGVSEEKNKKDK